MTDVLVKDGLRIRFIATVDRGVEVVVVLPEGLPRMHNVGRIDVQFAVAKGGGPRPVWTLRLPGARTESMWPTMMQAFFQAVGAPEHATAFGRTKAVSECLSNVLSDGASGTVRPYEEALGDALRCAFLSRLRRAYDCCLHFVTMVEIVAVQDEAMAHSVMSA